MKPETLRCGSCGEDKHKLTQLSDESILVICTKCFNESEITVTAPKLDIKWVAGSDGILAVF